MKNSVRAFLIGIGLTFLSTLPSAPARAQLPSLVPPIEVAAGVFTAGSAGGEDQNGFALKASVALNVMGDHGVAASAWYLNGRDMQFYALTGEYRRRFGPFSVGYWALGGGVGSSEGFRTTIEDGVVFTAGLGAQLAGFSVEGRALTGVSGGRTAAMLMVGRRF